MAAIFKDGRVFATTQAEYMTVRMNGETFSLQNVIGETVADLATIETTNIASKDYAIGEFLILQSSDAEQTGLFKIIAAITEGEEFENLVNIIKTNVGDELINVKNNATYSATLPIAINANNKNIYHAASGITAGQVGPTADQLPDFGDTFTTFAGTVNATGHLTGLVSRTVQIPNKTATSTAAGLMSAADKQKLDNIEDFLDLKYTVISTF